MNKVAKVWRAIHTRGKGDGNQRLGERQPTEIMGNDDWLDKAGESRAVRERKDREAAERQRQAHERMETRDALAAADAFWEAFKTEVRRVIGEWNRRSSNNPIAEGPQTGHVFVLYCQDRMQIDCMMEFTPQRYEERELRVSYRSRVHGPESRLVYSITRDDSGIKVGAFRSPEALATEVMKN